jgi:hypothetical protein
MVRPLSDLSRAYGTREILFVKNPALKRGTSIHPLRGCASQVTNSLVDRIAFWVEKNDLAQVQLANSGFDF